MKTILLDIGKSCVVRQLIIKCMVSYATDLISCNTKFVITQYLMPRISMQDSLGSLLFATVAATVLGMTSETDHTNDDPACFDSLVTPIIMERTTIT